MFLTTAHLLAAVAASGVTQAYVAQTPLGNAVSSNAAVSSKLSINSTVKMNSGYSIPHLGFGVYQTPYDVTKETVHLALKAGYRHFDSAIGYGNEKPAASALVASKIPREDLFFTTKLQTWTSQCQGYEAAKRCIAETMAKIGDLKYVDLYLIHSPKGGPESRLGGWRALVEAVAEGKIKSIGVSNYEVEHLEELEAWQKEQEKHVGKGKAGALSVNQVQLHPWLKREEVVKWCSDRGVILEAYSPLTQGRRLNDPVLLPIITRTGKSAAQVLIRYSLQKGYVPLPKSVTPSRIKENADIYDFEITEEEMKALDAAM